MMRFAIRLTPLLLSLYPTFAGTVHVDRSNPSDGDGVSWASAYNSLSAALGKAAPGDVILVAGGSYNPDAPDVSFLVEFELTIQGGYPKGGGTRDLAKNPTRLSSTGRIMSVARGSGPMTLDGLRFEGGEAIVTGNLQPGGAAIAMEEGGQLRLIDCHFENNLAWDAGSGFSYSPLGGDIYYHHSGGAVTDILTIENCTFDGASTPDPDAYGGAIYAKVPQATLTGCGFTGYRANRGGAVYLRTEGSGGGVVFSRCQFKGNEARFDGGAMDLNGGAHAVSFYNCLFSGNHAGDYGLPDTDGGAIQLGKSGPTSFTNCTFAYNTAGGDFSQLAGRGGAVAVIGAPAQSLTFHHNLFYRNYETAGLGAYVNAVNVPAGWSGQASYAGNHTSDEDLPDSVPGVPNHTPFSAGAWSPPVYRQPITLQTSSLGGATRFLPDSGGDLRMAYPNPLADLAAGGELGHPTLYLPSGHNEIDAAGDARSQGWVPDPGCFEAQPAPGTVEITGFKLDLNTRRSRLAFVSDVPVRVRRSYDLVFWSTSPVRTLSPYSRDETLQLQFGESAFYRIEQEP